ncbi:hypothetical protein U1Q18_023848 [Sarracenia purpurea var. burkii]
MLLNQSHPNLVFLRPYSPLPSKCRPKLCGQKQPFSRVFALANPSGSGDFPWLSLPQSIRRSSERFFSKFGDSVKKETGFDLKEANVRVAGFVGRFQEAAKKGEVEFYSSGLNWFLSSSIGINGSDGRMSRVGIPKESVPWCSIFLLCCFLVKEYTWRFELHS